MGKPEDTDPDSGNAENPTELKELQELMKPILYEDDYGVEVLEKAISTLSSLKEMKVKRIGITDEAIRIISFLKEMKVKKIGITDEAIRIVSSLKELKFNESVSSPLVVPKEFKCPISGEIMRDPVLLASGKTYDRRFIQKRFDKGHTTCPLTKQNLTNPVLTPNLMVRQMISEWYKKHGIELPKPLQKLNEDTINAVPDRCHLDSLLDGISSSASSLFVQKKSAKTLRKLTKKYPPFRDLFSTDDISRLLAPLSSGIACMHHADLQQDIIATVFNISIPEENVKVVAENPVVIPLLIDALRTGTLKTKRNAASAFLNLSALDSSRMLIGESGAIKALIDLLEEGHPSVMKEVSLAMHKLCHGVMAEKIRERAIREGAVKVVMRKITKGEFINSLLPVLETFPCNPSGAEEMGEMGAVSCLLKIIRESANKDSKIVENCAAVLLSICTHDDSQLIEMNQEEYAKGTISRVAKMGTLRAKRKATGIIDILNIGG